MEFSSIRMVTMIFSLPLHVASVVNIYQKLVSHHHFFLSARKLGECQAHFGVKGTSNEGQSNGTTKEDFD
ncbi:unnamed protein product [Sphagnum tenellum]